MVYVLFFLAQGTLLLVAAGLAGFPLTPAVVSFAAAGLFATVQS